MHDPMVVFRKSRVFSMKVLCLIVGIVFSGQCYANELFGLKLGTSEADLVKTGEVEYVNYAVHGRYKDGQLRQLYQARVNVPYPIESADYFVAVFEKTKGTVEGVQAWMENFQDFSSCSKRAASIADVISIKENRQVKIWDIWVAQYDAAETYWQIVTDLEKDGYWLHVGCLDKWFEDGRPILAVELYSKEFFGEVEKGRLRDNLGSFFPKK